MADEYENIANAYVENAKVIKEIVIPKIERRAIVAARRIIREIVMADGFYEKINSRVYSCNVPEEFCGNLEGHCGNCEAVLFAKGNLKAN